MSDLLPQGLKFLQLGWWLMHALAIWLIYAWAYRKGRRDEKLRQHADDRGTAPHGSSAPGSSRPGSSTR